MVELELREAPFSFDAVHDLHLPGFPATARRSQPTHAAASSVYPETKRHAG